MFAIPRGAMNRLFVGGHGRALALRDLLVLPIATLVTLVILGTAPAEAEDDLAPEWTFLPVATVLPEALAGGEIIGVGPQGVYVVRLGSPFADHAYHLVDHGQSQQLFASGDEAPGSGTLNRLRDLLVVSAEVMILDVILTGSPGSQFFRWESGVMTHLPVPDGVTWFLDRHDGQGSFLAWRELGSTQAEAWITDGQQDGPAIVLDWNDHASESVAGITADGSFLIRGSSQGATFYATSVYFRGNRTDILQTAHLDVDGESNQGSEVSAFALNSSGDVLVQREESPGGTRTLFLHRPGIPGEVVAQSGPFYSFFQGIRSRISGYPQLFIQADTAADPGLFTGPDGEADRLGGDFSAFDQPGLVLSFAAFGPHLHSPIFHESGVALFVVRLADQTTVTAVGTAALPEISTWINPAGGEWNEPSNWDRLAVPGGGAETLFDLEASYDVDVGARQSGRSRVEAGSLAFRNADLELIGSLSIGGAANLSLPEGRLRATMATVGSVSPEPEGPQETARLFVSNTETQVDVSASLRIGAAGAGEMFISDALVLAAEILIGGDGQGEVVITGPTEQPGGANGLGATATLGLGGPGGGTLLLEEGGRATATSVVIGRGELPGLQHSTIRMESYSFLGVIGGLTVGAQYPGLLDLAGGGRAEVFTDLIMGTVAHPDSSSLVNGEVRVAGILETEPTKLTVERDALLGMAAGTTVQVDVLDGGQIEVTREFSLADAAGSTAEVKVVGVGDGGFRSSLFVGEETVDRFMVGASGRGRLTIQDGGEVHSLANLFVGQESGSQGRVIIQGRSGEFPSELRAPIACIGGYGLCDTSPDAAGHLILLDGGTLILEGPLGVGPNGRLSGSGEIRAAFASIAGRVDPGVQIITPAPLAVASLNDDPDLPDLDGPGVLVIVGDVQLEPTAVLAMDIHGVDPALQDRLEITGTTVLGGTLELRFGNEYGPQQGDALTFLSADGGLDGSFDEVVIVGLEEGFEFELDFSDGEVALIALNDATVGIASEPGQPLPDPVPVITALRLYPNQPNPFNPQTVLVYELPQSGAVQLEVFDLRGRLVRTLVDGALAAGRYEVLWDGRNAQGREQPSGVYLSRLRADGREVVGRMTLVR